MFSPEPALAEPTQSWSFLELWVDPFLFPPKVLMLMGDEEGVYRILDPGADYKLVVTHADYESAKEWLPEDEYEQVQGQLLAEDVL